MHPALQSNAMKLGKQHRSRALAVTKADLRAAAATSATIGSDGANQTASDSVDEVRRQGADLKNPVRITKVSSVSEESNCHRLSLSQPIVCV
mmetsp:Transcript_31959/g.95707  ORF Transcript_31959/g.95707 Transcript_31959/m.95707 type:complete len:92 (+) Transcript_31959:3837-4112(+)